MKKILAFILTLTLLICACSFAVSAGVDPVESGMDSCFLIDSQNWGKMYMYAWDDEGNQLCGEWPGVELTEKFLTDNGETYIFSVPYGAIGVVFNSGYDSGYYDGSAIFQTVDCYDFEPGEIYYIDDSKDIMDNYYVKIFDYFPIPSAPVPKYIYFINSKKFANVYFYAWNDDYESVAGEWPGTMADYYDVDPDTGYKVYRIDIPFGTIGFILSDGISQQTEDVFSTIHAESYWLDGSKDENGNYLFKQYHRDVTPTTEPELETTEVYVNDDLNWGTGFMYAWDENGNALTKQWPGKMVEKIIKNDKIVYECNVPVNAKGFILSNSDDYKTIDILDFKNYDAYRILNETDSDGAYKVEGYNFDVPSCFELGDVNGDEIISVSDATLVQQFAAEMINLEALSLAAADTNHDKIISVSDATLIQQFAAEIITSFD